MSQHNNGGPSSHGTAAGYRNPSLRYTTLLIHDEACSRLQGIGFEYTDRVPPTDKGRIPARGKAHSNTSTALSWTADGQALHWNEFTTGDTGTIFADRAAAAKLLKQAEARRHEAGAETQALQNQIAHQAQDQ